MWFVGNLDGNQLYTVTLSNEEKAIRVYENFLCSTAKKLKRAGSPYGFITMGSAIAFTPDCYMKAGGISKKKATEDFKFFPCIFFAALKAILVAKDVFPIEGLPAIITKS